MEPLDPPSWDEMLDNLGYATDTEEDADLYYIRKASKNKVKPKVKEYDWDDYN